MNLSDLKIISVYNGQLIYWQIIYLICNFHNSYLNENICSDLSYVYLNHARYWLIAVINEVLYHKMFFNSRTHLNSFLRRLYSDVKGGQRTHVRPVRKGEKFWTILIRHASLFHSYRKCWRVNHLYEQGEIESWAILLVPCSCSPNSRNWLNRRVRVKNGRSG